jgi:hypothetical protein
MCSTSSALNHLQEEGSISSDCANAPTAIASLKRCRDTGEAAHLPSATTSFRGSRAQQTAACLTPGSGGETALAVKTTVAPYPSAATCSSSHNASRNSSSVSSSSVCLMQWINRRGRVVQPKESYWIFCEVKKNRDFEKSSIRTMVLMADG